MRNLTQQAHDMAIAVSAKETAYRAGDMDAAMAHHRRYQDLAALPADHPDVQFECIGCILRGRNPRFTGSHTVLCYVTINTNNAGDQTLFHLLTDRGGEHHLVFCPGCATVLLAHHSKRDVGDGIPAALPIGDPVAEEKE